jgi:serine/threonine protein kinase
LGLTILAVSSGKFPLSAKKKEVQTDKDVEGKDDDHFDTVDDNSSVPIGGGPGGYWAMIKAICDDAPPVPSSIFSDNFHSFIDVCLRKDPSERFTAEKLLSLPFIEAIDHDSLTESDKFKGYY